MVRHARHHAAALPLAHHHRDGEDAASSESSNDDSDECARAEAIGVGALGPDDLGSLNAGDGQVVNGEAVLDKLGDESGLEGFCGGEDAPVESAAAAVAAPSNEGRLISAVTITEPAVMERVTALVLTPASSASTVLIASSCSVP